MAEILQMIINDFYKAVGSLYELQTQIEIAFNLKYIEEQKHIGLTDLSIEIDKMLYSIIQKIK